MTIQTTRSPARYKDFYTNLDAHPVRKDLFVLEDVDSIKNSIKNIVFTDPGERFFQPLVGSGIKQSLFENLSAHSAYSIQVQIETTITNYEPRAALIKVIVNPIYDENAYNVQIIFSTINNPQPITFNVLLNRVR